MKKRWTFELIVDTELHGDEWSEDVELMTEEEATKRVKEDLAYMLEKLSFFSNWISRSNSWL